MPEENQNQTEQKNTVALVGMVFSIIGLILLFTIIGTRFGLILLCIGFILGIIGLFYKPRGRARVAVCIPLVVFIAIASVGCYIWSSVKTPVTQFGDWAKVNLGQLSEEEDFDNNRFNNIANEEFSNIFSSMNEDEIESLLKNSTGSNILEKGSYLIFGLLQQSLENSIERYHNELPEIDEENIDLGEVSEDIVDENIEDDNTSEGDEENIEEIEEDEIIEISDEPEENNIEQVLDSLE